MGDLHERLQSNIWIPLIQDALGIEGEIDSLVLDFRSGEFARIRINDGEESAVTAHGIMGIKTALGLDMIAQRIVVTMRRDHFVVFEVYQFIPPNISPEAVADLLKGESVGRLKKWGPT